MPSGDTKWMVLGAIALSFVSSAARAMPGFYVAKGADQPKNHSSHVVLMKSGDDTAVTVMPDYQGELAPFAWVTVVPADVTEERVETLKREFVSRLDQLTAPRFHEWWEMHPCEPGEAIQEWERSLKASQDTAFLGGMNFGSGEKVARELMLDVEAKKKDGEYTLSLLEGDADVASWLTDKGYRVSGGVTKALGPYLGSGVKVLVAEVDPKRVELIGGDWAQLSPLRFWTETPYDSLPLRLGLASGAERQEVIVYVIEPQHRFEVKNYENVFPPTNVQVDYVVKERMGEFYNSLYDLILAKTPDAFLNEFAWSLSGCGQPCATEPLVIHELLSLGGDIFERRVPEAERNPEPPEPTKEEEDKHKASLEGKTPKERRELEKQFDEERELIAQRKALLERHKYVITRLHYRYGEKTLKADPEFGPARGPLEGGIGVPKGPSGELPGDVREAKASRLQVRYNFLHPSKVVIKCDSPERWRWAKMPREVRMLRKVWQADDLARKSRTQIKAAEVVRNPVPSLGLAVPKPDAGAPDAGADAGVEAESSESKCGCRVPGAPRTPGAWLACGGLGVWLAARRRRLHRPTA